MLSCQSSLEDTLKPCVPQPITDNGSCAEMVNQCQLWVTGGLFQNEYCVLASFCYAWSNTDVLLLDEYPSYLSIPTTSQEARLSEDVFYSMTGGASTMSQQNAIDAYYGALVCRKPFPWICSLTTRSLLRLVPGRLRAGLLELRPPCGPPPTAHILLRAPICFQ